MPLVFEMPITQEVAAEIAAYLTDVEDQQVVLTPATETSARVATILIDWKAVGTHGANSGGWATDYRGAGGDAVSG